MTDESRPPADSDAPRRKAPVKRKHTVGRVVGISALVGLWSHHRAGTVQWGQGALFGLVGIGGAYLGTRASRGVDGNLLLTLFAALLVVVPAMDAILFVASRWIGAAVGWA